MGKRYNSNSRKYENGSLDMNNLMNKLERKFGRFAVHNLTVYLVACYGVGYLVMMAMPQLLIYFSLEPGLILQGQIWRLLSWVLIPTGGNFFVVLLMMYMYYLLGRSLEHTWGAFRYNVYIFSGMIFTIIGAFVLYFLSGGMIGFGMMFSPYYIYMSVFLACAAIVPDMELYLYFLIPIKMKWLAIFDVVMLAVNAVRGGMAVRIVIITSLLNFVIFFLCNRNMQRFSPKQAARRKKFQHAVKRPETRYEGGAKHRCAVCGRTELDDPNLEFRYCSKCKGNYEYCQDHLFTHEHVK